MNNWDAHWMGLARYVANSKSKDRSRKVAAVIVNNDNVDVATGWNGFPRGINDDVEERHQRPAKYRYSVHAEMNAITNSARTGRSTYGCKMYQTLYPCSNCTLALIQAGIKEVITIEPDWNDATYIDDYKISKELLEEAGIKVRFLEGEHAQRIEVI